ncbi:MAG: hypothetical protein JXR52_10930 [Bacteroidales bacterium]|nr:hypothetical protein [Bacteroidales bacterium]
MKTIKITALLFLILLLVVPTLKGQSTKDIRERNIRSQTVLEYFVEEGIPDPVVEKKEVYNEEGEITEIIEYDRNGVVQLWEKYKYDEDGNIIEQQFLNNKGKVDKREETVYKDGLRVERRFYDDRGRLYKRKVYEYEYRD